MSALLPSPDEVESKARKAVEEAYAEKLARLRREYERHASEIEAKYKALPRQFAERLSVG